MPLPATGSGAAVSKGKEKFSWALYLATTGSGAVAPTAKVGGAEPATWVRQGRLLEDQVNWNVSDPTFLDIKAGFKRVLQKRLVREAEIPLLTAPLDESDPDVMARLRGSSYSALSSGAYTGYQFVFTPGTIYNCKVLLIGTALDSNKERHVYAASAVVTFRPTTAEDHEGLEVSIALLQDTNLNAFTVNEWHTI